LTGAITKSRRKRESTNTSTHHDALICSLITGTNVV
jgi:hypothetical protein